MRKTVDSPSGYAQSGDIRVAYFEAGEGEPLLLINGGPGFPAEHFGSLGRKLAVEMPARVIRFDQRGTGRTRLPELSCDSLTLDCLANDIESLRTHLAIDAWAILGHSFGALIAMAYAAKHGSRVRSMILSAPVGPEPIYRQRLRENVLSRLSLEKQSALRNLPSADRLTYNGHLELLSILLPAYLHDQKHLPELEDAVVASRIFAPEVQSLVWRSVDQHELDLRSGLVGLRAPAFVIQGDDDPLTLESAAEIAGLLPRAELQVIRNAGHFSWLDNEQSYCAAIKHALVYSS